MNERLAALGQMASGIAHELNNPSGNHCSLQRRTSQPGGKGEYRLPPVPELSEDH